MLSLEGKQLGNYDVIRRIRVGGMGAVYEGRQRTAFDRRVAIKVILGDFAKDQDMRRRFMREARTVADLHHPNILPLIEFGEERGILFLVMPFIDGGTLTSYLRRSLPDLAEVTNLYQQILDAVENAHDEGLIHRDIKSSNIMLEMRRGKVPHIYLGDFGLVRIKSTRGGRRRHNGASWPGEASQSGKPIPLDQVPGTPHYMAPEQTRGIVTPLTDIYALGVLLFQMLTGELPYDSDDDIRVIEMQLYNPIPSPCERDASIPRELEGVVYKAMAKNPEDRYQSVSELRDAFLKAISGPRVELFTDTDDQPEEIVDHFLAPGIKPNPDFHSDSTVPNSERAPRPFPREASVHEVSSPRRLGQETTLEADPLQPQPIIMQQRQPRTTGEIRPKFAKSYQQRVTEEPTEVKIIRAHQPVRKRRRKQPAKPLIITSVALAVLVLLALIGTRAFGASLFAPGFPIFGGAPIATVYVTAQDKTLQNTFILTASPQVHSADLATHRIPAHLLKQSTQGTSTINTTGTHTTNAVQAHGSLIFSNTSRMPANLGVITLTHNGVSVRTTQVVQVPGKRFGSDKPGIITVPATAITPGANGNLDAHIFDGPCCANNISVSNTAPFSGGSDGQVIHTVQQNDIDGVKTDLVPRLKQQLTQQFQKSLDVNEVLATQPQFEVKITPEQPVGATTDRVKINVQVSGSVLSYDKGIATGIATELLKQEATRSLSTNFKLHGQPNQIGTINAKVGQNNAIYLTISVKGQWIYSFTDQQIASWPDYLKGTTSTTALAYLNQQPGVAQVELRLPFNTDHFPSDTNQIKIIVVDANQA
ncbi:protein kinase domain-containing protein [Ktedonospora formicarum]|uniref:Protein kinase domain-containing protein n=1 Tax=Ktedonospora formicarum TaxID=2778364 RepID=A0A8J3HYD8_9CHLR|nr:protein kinase [Ktedonospora formicarum]GHO42907.1 hypothetical protein KSX_10700 [Ktedonospora formicarum]